MPSVTTLTKDWAFGVLDVAVDDDHQFIGTHHAWKPPSGPAARAGQSGPHTWGRVNVTRRVYRRESAHRPEHDSGVSPGWPRRAELLAPVSGRRRGSTLRRWCQWHDDARLDDVRRQLVAPAVEQRASPRRVRHAATVRRQSRAEHVGHEPELVLVADRARRARCGVPTFFAARISSGWASHTWSWRSRPLRYSSMSARAPDGGRSGRAAAHPGAHRPTSTSPPG